jgi:hypothetical protein
VLDSGNGTGDPIDCEGEDCVDVEPLPLPDGFPQSVIDEFPCVQSRFFEATVVELTELGGGPQDNIGDQTLMDGEAQIIYRDSGELYLAANAGAASGNCPSDPCFLPGRLLQVGSAPRRPKLSGDGETLRFADAESGRQVIYELTRSNASTSFGTPVELQELGSGEEITPPYPGRDLEVWAVDGSLMSDIVLEQGFLELAASTFGGSIEDVWLSKDARVMVLAGGGEFDRLVLFARDEIATAWSEPVDLGPSINISDGSVELDNESPWMSDDLCVMYFSRRPDGSDSTIVRAERFPQ